MAWGDPAEWDGSLGTEESVQVGIDATMSPSSTRATLTVTLRPPQSGSLSAHEVATAVAQAWNAQRPIEFVVALPPTAGSSSDKRVIFAATRPGATVRDVLVGFQDKGLLALEIDEPLESLVNKGLTVTRRATEQY